MTPEDRQACILAIGRILRMGSRPEQPGDVAEYERCRAIVLELTDPSPGYTVNWVRDRMKGATGD